MVSTTEICNIYWRE